MMHLLGKLHGNQPLRGHNLFEPHNPLQAQDARLRLHVCTSLDEQRDDTRTPTRSIATWEGVSVRRKTAKLT